MSGERIFTFGSYRLDPHNAQLWRGKQLVPLTGKALGVLQYLAERPGQLVTKEELFAAVWPGVVVGESALTKRIYELRQAFREDPQRPRYIETVHRRGLRFLGKVASSRHSVVGSPLPPTQPSVPCPQFPVLVGRDTELELLENRLAAVKQGYGQVVGISGDPGIGKSRLLAEFRRHLAGHNVRYLEGHCLAYGTPAPGLPLLDLLRQYCQITAADKPEVIPHKVRSHLQAVELGPETDAPFLLSLLGMKEGAERLSSLGPEAIKARTFAVLRQLLLGISRQQPLVLALEDWHWIDKISEEFFASVVERLPGSAILLLATYRSGYRPTWIEKSYATQVALQPLSPQDSLTVLHSLPRTDQLPGALRREILTRAEGNPFFLEELAKAMHEEKGGHRPLPVPDTIQNVLLARIERLPDASKRLLQTAAVLGREFSFRLLREVGKGTVNFPHSLLELRQLEFLYEHEENKEPGYRFKHVLTQEVAYGHLPAPQRVTLHAATAQALETLYAERREDVYDRLAYHYAKTDDAGKAITYLTLFAEQAGRVYANTEAVEALQEALVQVERLPAEERTRRRLDVSLRLALPLSFLGRFREILDHLLPQQEYAARLREPLVAGPFFFRLALTYFYLGDAEHAVHSARRALVEARSCEDCATEGRTLYVLAAQEYWLGQPLQGTEHGQQAVTLLERAGELPYLGLAYWALGLNYFLTGAFPAALAAETQAQTIGERVEDLRLQSIASLTSGLISATMGEWETAIEACQRGFERAPDPFIAAMALNNKGYTYLEQGDLAQAFPLLEQAVQQSTQFRSRQLQGRFLIFLGEAYLLDGQTEKARELVTQGLALSQEIKMGFMVAWARRALGKIAHADGRLAEAESDLGAALQMFTAMSAQFETGRTHLALANLARGGGDRRAAAQHLTAAHQLFSALLVPKHVKLAERLARELGLSLFRSSRRGSVS